MITSFERIYRRVSGSIIFIVKESPVYQNIEVFAVRAKSQLVSVRKGKMTNPQLARPPSVLEQLLSTSDSKTEYSRVYFRHR